jgi:hypothetical protein
MRAVARGALTSAFGPGRTVAPTGASVGAAAVRTVVSALAARGTVGSAVGAATSVETHRLKRYAIG